MTIDEDDKVTKEGWVNHLEFIKSTYDGSTNVQTHVPENLTETQPEQHVIYN